MEYTPILHLYYVLVKQFVTFPFLLYFVNQLLLIFKIGKYFPNALKKNTLIFLMNKTSNFYWNKCNTTYPHTMVYFTHKSIPNALVSDQRTLLWC